MRRLVFHQFAAERAAGDAVVRIKDRQREREGEKYPSQPRSELHQYVRGLRAENVLRDARAKGCAETFTLWPLHKDNKNHQAGHYHEEHQAKIDQQVHRDAKYGERLGRSKRRTSNVEVRGVQPWTLSVGHSMFA